MVQCQADARMLCVQAGCSMRRSRAEQQHAVQPSTAQCWAREGHTVCRHLCLKLNRLLLGARDGDASCIVTLVDLTTTPHETPSPPLTDQQ